MEELQMMRKTKTQKPLAILLALVMIFGLMPLVASASDWEDLDAFPVAGISVEYDTSHTAGAGGRKDVDTYAADDGVLIVDCTGIFSTTEGSAADPNVGEVDWPFKPWVDITLGAVGSANFFGESVKGNKSWFSVDNSYGNTNVLTRDSKYGLWLEGVADGGKSSWANGSWFGDVQREDNSFNPTDVGLPFGMIGVVANGGDDCKIFVQLTFEYGEITEYNYTIANADGVEHRLTIILVGTFDVSLESLKYTIGDDLAETNIFGGVIDEGVTKVDDEWVWDVVLPYGTPAGAIINLVAVATDDAHAVVNNGDDISINLSKGMTCSFDIWNGYDDTFSIEEMQGRGSVETYTVNFSIDDNDDDKLVRALAALEGPFYVPSANYANDAAIGTAATAVAVSRLTDAGLIASTLSGSGYVKVGIYPDEDNEGDFLMDVVVGTKGVRSLEVPVVVFVLDDLETQLENAVKLIEAQDFIYIEDDEYKDEDGDTMHWKVVNAIAVAVNELLSGTEGFGPGKDVSDIVVYDWWDAGYGSLLEDKWIFEAYVIQLSDSEIVWDREEGDWNAKPAAPELLDEIIILEEKVKIKEDETDPPSLPTLEVIYDGNGGTPAKASDVVNLIAPSGDEENYTAILPTLPTATRAGYDFSGWTWLGIKQSSGDVVGSGDFTATGPNKITLIAQWTAVSTGDGGGTGGDTGGGGGGSSAPAAPAEPEVKPATTPKEQVSNVYQLAFGRAADAEGLAHWVDLMENKGWTPEQVIIAMLNSEEALKQEWTNDEYVTILYKLLFGRNPDPDGKTNWLSHLAAGKTKQWVLARFFESTEWNGVKANFMK